MNRGPTRDSCVSAMQPYLIRGDRKNIPPSSQPNFRNFVRINVNGRVFDLSRSTCIRIPVLQGMLTRGSKTSLEERKKGDTDSPSDEVYFERNPSVFAAVVDYVQNNELHVPTKVCPKLFARDLNFWGFDIDEVEPCCFSGVVHFLWEQEKLGKFHDFLRSTGSPQKQPNGRRMSKFESIRSMVWMVLDEPFTSIPARIYFYTMCFVILASFVTIAAGTLDMFNHIEHKPVFDEEKVTINVDLHFISHACNGYLYFDYLLRFLFCPSLRSFFMDLINVTDGLAVLSSIAKTITEEMIVVDNESHIEAIDILQLLRILRLVRPMSKVTGFRLIYFTLKCSFQELMLVFMLLGFLTIFFSTTLYYIDDGVCIESIPHGMWFALTTMTTVGYGDIVPEKV
ncbi:potassium voltage-gated channel protein Shaw-like [Littorina saxatilis]|uniref:potassium voltage-gated channel protein Shaw-like n=1 Tax=Littorina saxatilis TaxID=31220 RepID=UPI0038B6475F